ncbi:hypothetical protein N7448_003501 [Penicillium atrosanguineum]|uniref:Ubiquitin-conjugating enzyme E2 n=1 Tax=Penicillium atrosanguineum TaxID=1132637 RepID=UPI00239A136D|nr:Ubiquitin-conjugating enzyme E2 [Penicillium atrosanguineum]KAJ5122367.1 hypothetical protein N7526_009304 [Penicillium atrosanguineum]KAJ5140093.1 hypothetical protein N7448_003501 [Penicillium atrosanguineum]KAJ5310009.1 Ubiquitin-conjugating enzyme E2 [Penicillium atrosanguineum]
MTPEMQSFYTPSTSHMSRAPAAMDHLRSRYSSTRGSSAPRRNRRRNPFQRMFDRVRLEYYRYEVTFGVYVLTPNEKTVANTFVLIALALFFWALLYLPSLLYNKAGSLVWLLTGHNGQEAGTALGILDQDGDFISSAAESAFA